MLNRLFQQLSASHPDAAWVVGVRVLLAGLTALGIGVLSGGRIIRWLRHMQVTEDTAKTPIEDESLRRRIAQKSGTPTMGGLVVLPALLASCLLWSELGSGHFYVLAFCVVGLAALGFVDDWLKLKGKTHKDRGVKARYKLMVQGVVGCAAGLALWLWVAGGSEAPAAALFSRILGGWRGWAALLFALWVGLVVTVMSNATNITDGLDGLMGGLVVFAASALAAVACVVSRGRGWPLHGQSLTGVAQAGVFWAAIAGSCLGFLWFNRYPARVFMGDVGALAVGGALGLAAAIAGFELLLPLAAFVLLVELGSSLAQIFFYKLTGRRILPIAPLHHIFEGMGWKEPRIVRCFYMAGALCAAGTVVVASWWALGGG